MHSRKRRKILFVPLNENPIYGAPELCILDPITGDFSTIGHGRFDNTSLGWAPGGQYLALSIYDDVQDSSHISVYTYDLINDVMQPLIDGRSQAWCPKFSPTGEWLSYVDNARMTEELGNHELMLVRPDGSERIALARSNPDNPDFWGYYMHWSPNGDMIALGHAKFGATHRIAIFDSLFGSVGRTQFPAEDKLRSFLDQYYALTGLDKTYAADDYNTLTLGNQGISWSPNGEEIAFSMNFLGFAPPTFSRDLIVKGRVDGSGELELVADHRVTKPSYSPDGRSILFQRWVGFVVTHLQVVSDGIESSPFEEADGSIPYLEEGPGTWYL